MRLRTVTAPQPGAGHIASAHHRNMDEGGIAGELRQMHSEPSNQQRLNGYSAAATTDMNGTRPRLKNGITQSRSHATSSAL